MILVGTITVHICHMFAISRSKSSKKVSNDKTQKYLLFDIADFDNTIVRTMLEKWKGYSASGGTGAPPEFWDSDNWTESKIDILLKGAQII